MPVSEILREFGLNGEDTCVKDFGNGLINNTWKVTSGTSDYILQRINNNIFKEPEIIASNIDAIGKYLAAVSPDYRFTMPVATLSGMSMLYKPQYGYFRMFSFVEGSHSKDVVETPNQAYEAAAQFGKFTNLLSGFNVNKLQTTIPDFHNLSLRYKQFQQALKNGNPERIKETALLTNNLIGYASIVSTYEKITTSTDFKIRVTHHDTKISNVLFDDNDKGICVIDLDTVMPGYFISDVGDMMRTYLSPVSEEEKDFSKIEIRDSYYSALVHGYYSEMSDALTKIEQKHFFYAGTFIIYMQALRFLTDYLNNDIYYGAKYADHNLVRAGNQTVLLERLMEKRETLENIL